MTKGEQAEALFRQGYNCAQSVAGAFAGELGLPLDTAVRLVSGFGGGFGRLREVCGAVCGMTFVYSALRGYGQPGTHPEKTRTYAAVQRLANAYRAEAGSIVCRELLGLSAPEGTAQAEARTAAYYKKRPCPQLVHLAADLLAAELAGTLSEAKEGSRHLSCLELQ